MGAVIGIDLGTTYSVAARVGNDGRPVVIPNAEGEKTTPSVIWFGTDPPKVGLPAKEEQKLGATEIAAFFKRSMGDANYVLSFGGKDYTPIDLSTLVLKKIKADCEAVLKEAVTHAVITVPAYFDNVKREATIEAGKRAGLQVLRIINEPTAAALAYGVQQTGQTETCLVYDLGGGTFDVTVIHITPDEIAVLGTDGDHELGGKDWDDSVARFIATRFREEHGFDPLDNAVNYQDVLFHCEHAKQQLSTRNSYKVSVACNGVQGTYELTRAKLEELTAHLMERTQLLTEQVLNDAKPKPLTWKDVSCTLLVGGSTRMPIVRAYIERMSGKPPRLGINPDEAVALGAAVQAAMDMQAIAPRSVPECIAGARRVTDVMSHSLGVITESADRSRYINSKIIAKNQPIPASMVRPFQLRTRARGDNDLEVFVTQGEADEPFPSMIIGKYSFSQIEHVPESGLAVLEIKYDYDRSGVVSVSAAQRNTGKTLPVKVEPVPGDMAWLMQPPREVVVPAHLTAYLAFDLSGSMSGEPLAEAQKAAREFVAQTDLGHNSLGILSFADQNETTAHACQDARKLNRAIDSMTIGSVGYGNDASPFGHAHGLLKGVDDPRYIVLLTDGVWSDQPRAAREAKACHADGIEVIAIGLGGADRRFLEEISTAAAGSFFTDLSRLVETFSKIAQAITEGSGSLRRKD